MVSRTLVLPAIGVAVLPKCPMCVMVVLGALGLGHRLHETVFAVLQGAALVVVILLLVVRGRRAPAQVLLAAAGACSVILASAGPAPPAIGYAGAILLAAVWLAKPNGRQVPSCACALAEPPRSC